jgi:hypothetical protein
MALRTLTIKHAKHQIAINNYVPTKGIIILVYL